MALIEGCKHSLEITVPLAEVESETDRVIKDIQAKVKLPGFRPGKVPANLLRSRFESDIRKEVLEALIPKHFRRRAEEEHLDVVSAPDVTDLHFQAGEPLRFTAQFEVAPVIELGDYRNITVVYEQPDVTEQDVDKRLEELREQRADYVNLDPRPIENGDYVLVTLCDTRQPSKEDDSNDVQIHVGGPDTLPAFTENLLGLSPGDRKEFDVSYPEDFGSPRLAGKTVRFEAKVKVIRRKELPEINDDFARDLGDYKDLGELRDAVRKALLRDREQAARDAAKARIVDKLVDMHPFPVPEAYVDRQIELSAERDLGSLAAQGVDVSKVKLDWSKLKESRRDRAVREVKASLLIDRIAERESIETMTDEVDREIQRIAKRDREPVAATRRKLEKDGTLRRIAAHIRTEKTLNFLFENARKVASE